MTRAAMQLPYPVVVEDSLLDNVGEMIRGSMPAHSYAVISDENVAAIYGERVMRSFGNATVRLFVMRAGESGKTVDSWRSLSESLLRAGIARDSAVVALGGGIVGDVAGFVAATFMRGIPYIQVPTTVVAMVDSSIGGKTGVNTESGKNLLGAFHQPRAVYADPAVLATLPDRELRAGMAEVLKHGIIADADYFAMVREKLPEILASGGTCAAMSEIIRGSVAIKGSIVAQDERENGLRKILNFGHTVGHAMEAVSDYSMLHGEAVSIGMCVECAVAERAGLAVPGTTAHARDALALAGLPTLRPAAMTPAAIVAAAATDKKAREGELELSLPSAIGAMAGAGSGWAVRVAREQLMAVLQDSALSEAP